MYVGIDAAKAKFDVVLLTPDGKPKHKVFANSPEGYCTLCEWLGQQEAPANPSVHACLEATGSYAEALARYLLVQGYTVSLVNPSAIWAFGRSRLSRTKTDKVDATLIARYCQAHQPPPWTPPALEISELQALVRRLESLVQMRTMETNRLAAGVSCATVRESLEATLAFLAEQIARTQQAIREHLNGSPSLKAKKDLLTSIPGVGEGTAVLVLSELPDVAQFRRAGQAAAYAGLVPRQRQSGSSVNARPRLSKLGSSRLRKGLFFPALVALRFNPLVRDFGERLSARGKSRMAVAGAAMRKLLHIIFGVLRTGKPFDPHLASKTAHST
jgi:transposase